MTTQKVFEDDKRRNWCFGRAEMVIPGQVIWVTAGGSSIIIYDDDINSVSTIHEF